MHCNVIKQNFPFSLLIYHLCLGFNLCAINTSLQDEVPWVSLSNFSRHSRHSSILSHLGVRLFAGSLQSPEATQLRLFWELTHFRSVSRKESIEALLLCHAAALQLQRVAKR